MANQSYSTPLINIQKQQVPNTTRLRTFDFLRGLAILGVIIVHTSQNFPSQIKSIDFLAGFGRFGVQLFYFISALTMCYMWELRKGENNPIKNFYIRRFFRIAPLFWIAIVGYFYLSNRSIFDSKEIIFLSSTFLHGFFPSAINSIVPGGGTIAVEMTFYLIFPLLILKITDKRHIYLFLSIFTWLIYTFFLRNYLLNELLESGLSLEKSREFLYITFPNQAPIFLLGCYLYFLIKDRNIPKIHEMFIITLWFVFCAIFGYTNNEGHFSFPSVYIGIGIFVFFCIKRNLKFKYIELLGTNSYSMYLTHWVVIEFLAFALPLRQGIFTLLVTIPLVTSISYGISIFINTFIEKRIQKFVSDITKP